MSIWELSKGVGFTEIEIRGDDPQVVAFAEHLLSGLLPFCLQEPATAVSSRLKDGREIMPLINQSLRNIFPYYNKLFTVHLSFSSWAFNSSKESNLMSPRTY